VVHQRDAQGNVSAAATYEWDVDTTAPAAPISLAGPAKSPTKSQSATLSWTAAESGGTFECQIDSQAVEACASPKSLVALAAGGHSFKVRQKDDVGNRGNWSDPFTWTIDTTAPAAPLITGKPETVNPTNPLAKLALSNLANPTFSFTGESGATFECRRDAGDWGSCASPNVLPAVATGSHTFSVRQTDSAGNAGPASEYTWVVDLIAPIAPKITVKPILIGNVDSAKFTFTSSDKSAPTTCSLDGGPFTACAAGKSIAFTKLVEQQHVFTVRAGDVAGNFGVASYTWTIDKTPIDLGTSLGGGRFKVPTGVIYCIDARPDVTGLAKAEWSSASKSPLVTAKPVASKLVASRALLPTDPCPNSSNLALSKPVVFIKTSSTIKWMRFLDLAGNWSKWFMAG
jgi:hypothetical protein